MAKIEPPPGATLGVLDQCHLWVKECIRADYQVIVPAICYYETLRELERLRAASQINRLKQFCTNIPGRYLSITDADLEQAARLWAQARHRGTPTADPLALDGDVILAAQVINLGLSPTDYVVATTNPGHLSQFLSVDLWTNIAI